MKQLTLAEASFTYLKPIYGAVTDFSRKLQEQRKKAEYLTKEQKDRILPYSSALIYQAFSCCGAIEISPVYQLSEEESIDLAKNHLIPEKKVIFWIEATDEFGREYHFTRVMKRYGANPVFSFHNPNYKNGNFCTLWVWAPRSAALDAPKTINYSTSDYEPDANKISLYQETMKRYNYVNHYHNGITLSKTTS